MSVVTRTNRATNPNVATSTGYAAIPGTSGVASGSVNTGAGYDGKANFWRVSWTGGTTAVSGGASYLQTGLTASTQYTLSMWVRSSKAQTVSLKAQFQTSASANVNLLTGSSVALIADAWTRLSVSGTSGAAVDRVLLQATATTGGSNWGIDNFDIDAVLIETSSVLDYFFDGSYTNGLGVEYAWSGAADASTSTAKLYTPALALLAKNDAPTDRVQITITDLPPTSQTVTLWRTADGERLPVRSYDNVQVIGSDVTTDYEVSLGRLLTYELEVLSGSGTGGPTASATITVTATSGWIQDPLDPSTALRIYGDYATDGAFLDEDSLKSLTMPANVNTIQIMGSKRQVALMSERLIQSGLSFKMVTDAVAASDALRLLLEQTPLLLIRPLPEWSAALPGLCYTAAPAPEEHPITEARGGTLIEWKFDTGLVEAPKMNFVIPVWTYQDWQALWPTFQGAQTAHSGKTYLQAKISPTGA